MSLVQHLIHAGLHSAPEETIGGVVGGLVTTAVAPSVVTTIGGGVATAAGAIGITVGAPAVIGTLVIAGVIGGGIHLIKNIMK
jgi:hypothetical protein